MSKVRTPYPPEFRAKVVELIGAGRSVTDAAREFHVAEQTIRNWIKQLDLGAGRRRDGLTSTERDELGKLRRENKQLRIERDILKKAAAWFAQETETVPPKHSSS